MEAGPAPIHGPNRLAPSPGETTAVATRQRSPRKAETLESLERPLILLSGAEEASHPLPPCWPPQTGREAACSWIQTSCVLTWQGDLPTAKAVIATKPRGLRLIVRVGNGGKRSAPVGWVEDR